MRKNLKQTLQGYIHLAEDPTNNNQPIIMKETKKTYVESGMCRYGCGVYEDFKEEQRIIEYISNQSDIKGKGICCIYKNYIWKDDESYYYAMEYCENTLFDYINLQWQLFQTDEKLIKIFKEHKKQNKPYKLWIDVVKVIFQRICLSVCFLHDRGLYAVLYFIIHQIKVVFILLFTIVIVCY